MIPLNKRKRGKNSGSKLVAAGMILFFLNFFVPSLLPTIAYYLVSPIWWIERQISGSDRKIVVSEQALVDENFSLRSRVSELETKAIRLDAVEEENAALKAIGAPVERDKGILAAVLARPSVSPYDTIIIDAGTDKGVGVGDFVTSGEVVLGQISEVHRAFSKAILISSPGMTMNVTVGESRIQSAAYGQGGGSLFIRVPREFTVKDGDSIVLPELGNRPIGKAKLVNDDPSSSFVKVLFTLPESIYSLRWVTVEQNILKH